MPSDCQVSLIINGCPSVKCNRNTPTKLLRKKVMRLPILKSNKEKFGGQFLRYFAQESIHSHLCVIVNRRE